MTTFASDLMHDDLAVKEKPASCKCTCSYCGEYLGEIVSRKLIKDGKVVIKPHKCRRGG